MTESPADWLMHQARVRPHATALASTTGVSTTGEYDYAGLLAHIEQLAGRYVAAGLVPGEPLAALSHSAHRIAFSAYLAAYLGCPLLPLEPLRCHNQALLKTCAIRQAIVDPNLEPPAGLRCLSSDWLAKQGPGVQTPPQLRASADTQLLIATSGTTGTPRVVALTGQNLQASVRASQHHLGLGPGDTWLNCLPLFHIGGFAIVLRCLSAGAAMLLHNPFDAARVGRTLTSTGVTHISLVPAMLARLLESGIDIRRTKLRTALIVGGALDESIARQAIKSGWPLCVSYGMTETASHITLNCELGDSWQSGDVGQPVCGAQISIVDKDNQPTGGVGRIRVAGPMVMAGVMAGVMTGVVTGCGSKTKIPIPAASAHFVSNDLGCLDERGHLHLVGRADDLLNSGGRTIHPHEVERLIELCPGVREVAVASRPDSVWGDQLVACVAAEISLDAVERWCRAKLPGSLRPREFKAVKQLPRNAVGKLLRHRLP